VHQGMILLSKEEIGIIVSQMYSRWISFMISFQLHTCKRKVSKKFWCKIRPTANINSVIFDKHDDSQKTCLNPERNVNKDPSSMVIGMKQIFYWKKPPWKLIVFHKLHQEPVVVNMTKYDEWG
jgi:hypothetical protein